MLPVSAVSESRVGLYLAFYFPCAAAAPSSDKAVCCPPDPRSRIPRIGMLVRGGAELSKGFFSALCKPRTILATIFRGLEKMPGPQPWLEGSWSWLRCGAGRVENGCGIFPATGCAAGAAALVPGR